MQNRVLVLDRNKQPLMPCHPARARALLKAGKAAVFRKFPFTLILKEREGGAVQETRVKLDPGSKVTGIAMVAEFLRRGAIVVWAAELTHRGWAIKKSLEQRKRHRSFRRSRLRYRPARYLNRTNPMGWLPPSLQHRVDTTLTWVRKLARWAPVTALSQELVRFDTQVMQNPEISGAEYQQGTLQGYEIREYLLEKWGRECAYCGAENVPFEIDHIHPRSRGGSNRISNLTLACHGCNQRKGNMLVEQFLTRNPERLRRILAQAKAPLRDAAAVNSTRWALYRGLKATGLPVEVGTGGRTKYNRTHQGYTKAHWIDAACVGESGGSVRLPIGQSILLLKAMGHGKRQRTRLNKYGFPVTYKVVTKFSWGFQTGDIVKALITRGKFIGTYTSRVVVRAKPSFTLSHKVLEGIFKVHPKNLTILHRNDGYSYL